MPEGKGRPFTKKDKKVNKQLNELMEGQSKKAGLKPEFGKKFAKKVILDKDAKKLDKRIKSK